MNAAMEEAPVLAGDGPAEADAKIWSVAESFESLFIFVSS
jgi:hypothetical protein